MRRLTQRSNQPLPVIAKKFRTKPLFLLLPVFLTLGFLLSQNTNADTGNTAPGKGTNPGSLNPGLLALNGGVSRAPSKSEVMSLPAGAFRLVNNTASASYDVFMGSVFVAGGISNVDFVAPVLLPQGAQINSVELYALDMEKDFDLTCRVVAHSPVFDEAGKGIAIGGTNGVFGSIKSWPLQIKNGSIDNGKFNYEVHCTATKWPAPGGSFKLTSVVIKYTYNPSN